MAAPRGGWLVAALASALVLGVVGVASGTPLQSASIDIRHRLVSVRPERDGRSGTSNGDGPTSPGEKTATGRQSSRDARTPEVGVNVFLEQEVEPDKRQLSLDLIRAAGITTIRQQVPWEQIEPVAKGQFVDPKFGNSTWDNFDDIVQRANASHVQVVLRLDTSPRWALPASAPDGLGPPVNYDDYWDFVGQVAARYRGRVKGYQVWNEPNLTSEWGHQPPDPDGYARLLRGAWDRIHAADPAATVVMAALAPTLTNNADARDELQYLQSLYDGGARGTFDVLATQVYGLRGGPDDPRMDRSDVTFSRPALVREVMVRNGDGGTRVWATEMGWNANPDWITEQHFGQVTPTLQARYTVRGVHRIGEQWPWLDLVCVWFWKRADDTNRGQDWFWFRLADPDFSLQPVYYALRDAAALGWR